MLGTRAGLWVVTIVALLAALALVGSLIDTAWAGAVGSALVLLVCLGGIRNLRGRMDRLGG
jgi:hypothetical protein